MFFMLFYFLPKKLNKVSDASCIKLFKYILFIFDFSKKKNQRMLNIFVHIWIIIYSKMKNKNNNKLFAL